VKAAVVAGPGRPWRLAEVPTPAAGPGEVLVRVRASGVCHNDLWLTDGTFPFPKLDPVVVGHEAAGEVAAVGAGVADREVGDRVGVTWVQAGCGRCAYCRQRRPLTGTTAMLCAAPTLSGMTAQGTHAEYVAVRAEATALLPADVEFPEAAALMCAGYTAYSALRAGDPKPGERVAVLGVGGLGHLALQYAKALGHETVAVTTSPDKHEAAREFGADQVAADGAELAALGGADVVVATAPSHEAAAASLRGLRPGGRLVLAAIDPRTPFQIPPTSPIWARGQSVVGATHAGPEVLAEALALAAGGRVRPRVEVYAAERVADAVASAAGGTARFRAVVAY
jgi:D-arabinose 1-dehydrogenase-like Zn-dependent alcohol dehydrogenase